MVLHIQLAFHLVILCVAFSLSLGLIYLGLLHIVIVVLLVRVFLLFSSPPSSLLLPFARFVAQNSVSFFRRYSIDRIVRPTSAGSQPEECWLAQFDVILPTSGSAGGIAGGGSERGNRTPEEIEVRNLALSDFFRYILLPSIRLLSCTSIYSFSSPCLCVCLVDGRSGNL